MKTTLNAFYKGRQPLVSFWTIILVFVCGIPSSFLSHLKSVPHCDDLTLQKENTKYFEFTHSIYNVTIPENSVGRTYATSVPYEDLLGFKIQPHFEVKFRITSGDRDKLFKAEERVVGDFVFLTIRTRTSNIILNREKNDLYILGIKAIIHSSEDKSINYESDSTVYVRVLDRNDLSPLFYPTEYTKVIPEDTPIHKSILNVMAEDADIGINGEIYYSFLEENEYFSIHPSSGAIMLTKQLKYTEISQFEFFIIANDRGSIITHHVHQANKAKVTISVEQVNFYAPEIYVKTFSSINTNFSSLAYGKVKVADKDSLRHGEINALKIMDGDPDGNFLIKPMESKGEYLIEISRFAKLKPSPYIYNLTLRAEDKGVPVRYSYKKVPIQIFPENKNSPVFTKQLYEISIPETSPPNMPVIRLKVTDPDLGKNALVFLEIVGGNEGGEFRINPDSGMLYTNKLLDAEYKSFYTLTVSAIDQANVGIRKQSSAKVKVNVIDVNDNDPIFEYINTTILVDENERAGAYVIKLTAKDKDSGENSYISYSIANLNDVPFEIDHFSGTIRTTALLDYETMRRKYILNVRASDWGLPYRRQTEQDLTVIVKDKNDNRPQFERVNCFGQIMRNIPVGTDLITISAIDFDAGDYISYRIVSGNEDGCFNLDPTIGVLSVGCDLSDVGQTSRNINISATDGIHFSDELNVQIELLNEHSNGYFKQDVLFGYSSFECHETGVARRFAETLAAAEKNNSDPVDSVAKNDFPLMPRRYGENLHSPEFVDFPQDLKINESVQLGETVIWVKARDKDLGYNGKLVYAISDGDFESVFRIDPDSGELQIIGYLDRERQTEYVLNVTVFDLGKPQRFASKMLPIEVLDSNDNQPIFKKAKANFRLTENALNGTIVFCLNATDADSGRNAEIQYSMQTETSDFLINATNGCISLNNTLDRERQEEYELFLIARDNGKVPLSSEAVINILVEDINDNAPVFGIQEFIFKVREDIPRGTVVATIEANDFDAGLNSEIFFLLKEETAEKGLFKIDKYNGVIRTQAYLDYETRHVHNLIISAIDRGTPALTTDMPLVIEVIDVNENRFAPEFEDFVFIGRVKENQPKGSFVMNITAKDADINEPDSKISYSIRGGDGLGLFTVNDLGSIRTLSYLDAETKSSYWLTLCAQDHGIVPLSSCVQVYIEIENENDNVPLTDKPIYHRSVPEGSPKHTLVIQLEGIDNDNDPSQKITYTIISGNPEGFFEIDSITGELTTTERKLDRENQAEHTLEVSVRDNGTPSLSSTTRVVVTVEDENDHSPEFDQRFYKMQVPASTDINETVYQVKAFDSDVGANGEVSYIIKSGRGKNKFRIDSESGFIYAAKQLEPDTEYELNIRADDNGTPKRSQNARLNIVTVSIPENSSHAPVIKNTDTVVDITESDRPGFLVTLIQATDEDDDYLWYNISGGNDKNEFYMGRDNGNILLAKALDWETQSLYNLTITVTDGTFAVHTQLYVQVVDINDNRPKFTKDVYYVNISENIEEESIIMQLHATDADEDKKIFYTLHAAQDLTSLSLFRVDSISGNVVITQKLDYEKSKQHVLIVIAKDLGTPAKKNYAKIVISVHDHNDHYPEFTSKFIESKIPESLAVYSKVVQLYALDQDCGKNAEIKYSIISGNIGNIFDIDPTLGIIRLAKPLNINQMQEYMLQVKATDLGDPPLSSQIPVHLTVTMSETDPPRFEQPNKTLEIYENLPIGTFVTQVETRSSSSVFYELISESEEDALFHINPSTGIIVTRDKIDYEKNRSFNLTICGTNMASSSAKHSVIIHVLDVNDNAPIFLQNEYFGEISEAAEPGALVGEGNTSSKRTLLLRAADADSGKNSMLRYSILDTESKRHFEIDASTGAVRLLKQLDYESNPQYKFDVMAFDMGTPKLFSKSMATVTISVTNVNDCPPIFKKLEENVTLYLPTYDNIIVTKVVASDADLDVDTRIRYDIVDGNSDDCFQINQFTGEITTRNVNRINTFYTLHIRASDGLYSTILQLDIIVESSDNTGFVFQKQKYEYSTMENSSKIVTIGLVNVVGNFLYEEVEYKILTPTDMFQIGITSGAIKTTGQIFDREKHDHYKLIVEAKSVFSYNNHKNVRRAHALVEVAIIDANDNCPIFVNLPYYATISVDDLKGSLVMEVKAVDLDSFENGEVRYELKKGNGELFKIDRKSGQITLKQNIEGHHRSYDLVIAAYDGAITPCSTDASVNIKIVDKSMPLFSKQFYSDTVEEDVELFSALSLSIHAESPLKRKLIYTISKGNEEELFEIDYRTGVLYVVNELDYESQTSHELKIRATDSISGIFAEVTASIQVSDANDCYPAIENDNYYIALPENTVFRAQILKVNASDCDTKANSELSYAIESINGYNSSDLFYIDIADGSLYVKNSLDYEQTRSFHLIILVKDHGIPSLSSKTNIWITVKDLNDNIPRFLEPSYSSRLSVLSGRGQFVTLTKAYDFDYSDNDHLKYKIVDGNELQTYSVIESTGIISLQNLQNFTDSQQTFLNISVTDGLHTSYTRVKVALMSENLHVPIFARTVYEASIQENKPPGVHITTLQAKDADTGDSGRISYEIVSDEMNEYFEIDKKIGLLVSKISFDREKRLHYDVLVKATDSNGNFAFSLVKLKIEDENDNRPLFNMKGYKLVQSHKVPINSTLLKVTARDLDDNHSGFLKYTINPETLNAIYNDYLSINELDGSILLKRSAETLTNALIQFSVRASDNGVPVLYNDVPVSIQFVGSDVAVPEFERRIVKLQVLESTPPGSVITKLRVPGNFSVKFTIGTDTTRFFVAENGELVLMQTLDREENDLHHLFVVLETTSTPVLFAFTEIYVHVQDENDNYPKFDSSVYSVDVPENIDVASSIIKVSAFDPDEGPNGDVRYYLEENNPVISNTFDIDVYSGWITLLTPLDRETQPEYFFNVLASDNGLQKHISKAPVAIKLIDYNDNPPVFQQAHFNISVFENALPGTVLTQFVLTDLDAKKGEVSFFIIAGDNQSRFQIGKAGELFVSKPLDRELQPVYNLSLLATDGKFVSESSAVITLLDINDNVPYCLTPRYKIAINESIPIGTVVGKIITIDNDTNAKEQLKFYLTGNESEHFAIEKDTGIIRVAMLIDRESYPKYTLLAHAQDGQNVLKECVSEIFVTVNDLNDNKPEFSTQQYIVSIAEDAQLQTIITKVHATDKDFGLNRKISYSINDKTGHFNICPSTGIITLAKTLDREYISIFNISIKAEDHGYPKLYSTSSLIVHILDINDNPPEFALKQYVAYLPEDVAVDAEVSRLFATSKDIGVNAEILYFIVGGNEQKKFVIDSNTGVVYVKATLDYEKTKSYFLTIQAVDRGTPPLSNVAFLNITVTDVNDNKPVFLQNMYRVKVAEDIAIGKGILVVAATDKDSAENSVIKYKIERGDKSNQFQIEELSGNIIVADILDRESIAKYRLEIMACDSGTPELCNYVHVNIDVLDVNDNPPLFEKTNYSTVVQENKELGYVILVFNVTDADESPNTTPYTFDFRNGNEGGLFRLEQDGTLRTASRFNHHVRDLYTIQIRVFDNGTPPLYSDTWISIKIIEESQYPPTITPLEITINSFKDDYYGGYLGRVHASDQDKYDVLSFDISDTSEKSLMRNLFNISQQNGNLFAISNLDVGFYKLNVTVSDGKFTSSAIVKIYVELITLDMIRNGAIIKFRSISPEEFILSHRKGFIRALRAAMYCRQKDIVIITLHSSAEPTIAIESHFNNTLKRSVRKRSSFDKNLDVVFTIKKQQINPTSEGYFSAEEIRTAVMNNFEEIEDGTNLVIERMESFACQNNNCVHGKCATRIFLNKTALQTFSTDVVSFVTPSYSQVNECDCKPGYGGRNCDEPVNACSSDPCGSGKQCRQAASEEGYHCICPYGYTGRFCENKNSKCHNSSCENTYTSVSFSGKSYAHYKINKSVAKTTLENQFIYSLQIRTVQQTGTLLYASGKIDFNILEVSNGAVQYRFDLGSGEGAIGVSSVYVSDGKWHSIKLERFLNSAKITVDSKHISQGSAPGSNGILNIQSNDVFVGAEVRPHPTILGFEDVQRGFIGCMADIKFGFEPLPLYLSGGSSIAALKRFTNVEFTCDPSNVLLPLGVCGAQPCLNGGICIDLGQNNFKCNCHARFTGQHCEFDMDPCTSSPCLFGGLCKYHAPGNYSCTCPIHLSGRRCEYGKFCTPNPCENGGICEEGDGMPHCMCRGYTGPLCEIDVNECENQPCGNGATCINEAGSFRCICPSYLTGASCGDPLYSNSISTKLKNLSLEHITGIIFGVIIVFVVIVAVLCALVLRKTNSNTENHFPYGKSNCKEENLNSLMSKERYNKHNTKLSNLEVNHRPNFTPSLNENIFPTGAAYVNNFDILQSYGSAGDELENIPLEYQKINGSRQQNNINRCNLNEEEGSHKQEWSEQIHLKTFSENKFNNDKAVHFSLPVNRLTLRPTCGKLIEVAMPNVCYSNNSAEYSPYGHGQYHWDCSDWVRKSHDPLPDITEVPGAEVIDSSSFHSNDSNESKPKSSYVMHNVGDVDPSRDITTLNEEGTSEYGDSEVETCMQPFQTPLIHNNSLSRLSPCNLSENEDYKLNTVPSSTKSKGSYNAKDVYACAKNKRNPNSLTSMHICEIEDSETEKFLPMQRSSDER